MNRKEAKIIITSMMTMFPNYKVSDIDIAVKGWALAMDDYTYEQVSIALNAYIRSNTTGFAPVPGQLIEIIHKAESPHELNESEAWAMVSKALRNSGYNYLEEFAKLPPLVQKAVGLPEQLHTWALDENYNEEVVSSHFINCYRVEAKRAHEISKMPNEMRKLIAETNRKSFSGQIADKRAEAVQRAQAKSNVVFLGDRRAEAPEDAMERVEEMWERKAR